MVKHCEGLPLAVIVLGGILAAKHSEEEWENVLRNIRYFLGKGKSTVEQQASASATLDEILSLSYDDLPHRLKPCFLYMAAFPEDASIDAELLYHMWMAERLVSMEDKMGEEEVLINIAERYLGELVQRCMVQVKSKDFPMIIKFESCRLHDVMRDLCVRKARDENFLQCIDDYKQRTNTRRLVMTIDPYNSYSYVMENHVRSLQLHIHRDVLFYVKAQLEDQLKKCKLLRVLLLEIQWGHTDVSSLGETFESDYYLPKSVGNLSHLRFLCVRADYLILQHALNKLENLQTLDIRSFTKAVPPMLQDLIKLRYLYLPLNPESMVPNNKLRLHTLEKLEVLEYFNPRYYNANDLSKLTNLVQFSTDVEVYVRSSVTDIVNVVIKAISNLGKLRHSSLKFNLSSVTLTTLRELFECGIGKFPGDQSALSRSLKELHLASFRIQEEENFMETFENFPNLQILDLRRCTGVRKIIFHSNSFPQLKLLHLNSFLDLKEWRVNDGALPKLHYLTLIYCPNLEMIPDGLSLITSLKALNIHKMNKEFNDRVRVVNGQEGADFHKVCHVPSINIQSHYHY